VTARLILFAFDLLLGVQRDSESTVNVLKYSKVKE
jgi:hypothetical protein